MKTRVVASIVEVNQYAIFTFFTSICFLLLFCKNGVAELVSSSKKEKILYHPAIFLKPVKEIDSMEVKETFDYKKNTDSIHKFSYGDGFNYVLLQKKVKDWWDYYPYLDLNNLKHPINKEYIPSPGLVICCVRYRLSPDEDMIFFYYFGDMVSSTRLTPDLVISKFDRKSKKYNVIFSGNHFEYKTEDFGEYKGNFYFLNDYGRERVDVYKYMKGRFEQDATRKIILKDSSGVGVRFVDWDKTLWP